MDIVANLVNINSMKLPKTKIVVEMKEFLTYKEVRSFEEKMFDGAKVGEDGKVDQASLLKNVKKQEEFLVLTAIKSFNGKEVVTEEDLLELPYNDYTVIKELANDLMKKKD